MDHLHELVHTCAVIYILKALQCCSLRPVANLKRMKGGWLKLGCKWVEGGPDIIPPSNGWLQYVSSWNLALMCFSFSLFSHLLQVAMVTWAASPQTRWGVCIQPVGGTRKRFWRLPSGEVKSQPGFLSAFQKGFANVIQQFDFVNKVPTLCRKLSLSKYD